MSSASRGNVSALRVLHVVGRLDQGGTETWLLHVVQHVARQRLQMDFLVHADRTGAYDVELCRSGCRVICCRLSSGIQALSYGRRLLRVLLAYGPYDIVHSHVHHFSGYVLRVARRAGVPVRIAHSHNNTSYAEARAAWMRRAYLRLMTAWVRRYATIGLAASRQAAEDLAGPRWEADPRWRVLHCGVDLAPFKDRADATVRTELGIPRDALVVGHVGRFHDQKNHRFLVEVFAEVARLEPRAWLLLVGTGPLWDEVRAATRKLGISECVTMAGARADVPRVMKGAMDVFVFPSLYEGLGLALVEAQAAGLPCVVSTAVPEESTVVAPLVRRLSLARPPSEWASVVLDVLARGKPVSDLDALAAVRHSPFDVQCSAAKLLALYKTETARGSS